MQISLRHANERGVHLAKQLAVSAQDRDALSATVTALEAALAEAKQVAAEERANDAGAQSTARRAEHGLCVLRRRVATLEEEADVARVERKDAAEELNGRQESEAKLREELQRAGKAMIMAQVRFACHEVVTAVACLVPVPTLGCVRQM